jgi:PIN domain nuclease of toxin-antitoxin system
VPGHLRCDRDPCDRILIAQALSEPLYLVTTDARLKPYSELVVLV